ncbi:heme peroxidase [Mycena alexandri]|uniref:Peroxidase n=1 Tax=Mycena alexandri TaxID=1745969 RepID=A0AAD6T0Y0_9AGAR|nr:heme peroxidase [Mycena alexandri]
MLRLALLTCVATATAYVWPSPKLDALEAMRWDQDDPHSGLPCGFFTFSDTDAPTGRANTADWIRTEYATHDVTDGTGGLDASIRFPEEQSRGENPGTGFVNTMEVFTSQNTRYISIADLVAIGLITSVETCGGPQIAFRGGRIDAGEPNNPGVPEPTQDLDSHTAAFARQGFTPTEMIGLVACGHTFGGVEHTVFPDTVPDLHDPNNTLSVEHFDTTFDHFDNNVATEYISGTTQNPLVVGANDTTNSDKRIFASDGNKTMVGSVTPFVLRILPFMPSYSFAQSADLFASTCASLFARMIDTVPAGVELTEVIEPLPVKPALISLILDGDNLKLPGLVRLFGVSLNSSRKVTIEWDDHAGGTRNTTLVDDHQSTSMARIPSAWYAFNSSDTALPALWIEPKVGVTAMRFTVDGKVEDQGGVGFAVEDGYVFSASSCLTSTNPIAGRFDIAVRNGVNPTRIFLEQEVKDAVDRVNVQETNLRAPAQPVTAGDSYSLWSIDVNSTDPYTIGAEIGGVKFSTVTQHSLFDLTLCAPQRRIQHKRGPKPF